MAAPVLEIMDGFLFYLKINKDNVIFLYLLRDMIVRKRELG
jgi:hypothetical protein